MFRANKITIRMTKPIGNQNFKFIISDFQHATLSAVVLRFILHTILFTIVK